MSVEGRELQWESEYRCVQMSEDIEHVTASVFRDQQEAIGKQCACESKYLQRAE